MLNVRDHFTKFSVMIPLRTKTGKKIHFLHPDCKLSISTRTRVNVAEEVSYWLSLTFAILGPPSICQSDRGPEFTVAQTADVVRSWATQLIHGSVRHPQSQGGVERSNGTIEATIERICFETRKSWFDALPHALCRLHSESNTVGYWLIRYVIFSRSR